MSNESKQLTKAVELAQLYCGSMGHMRISDAQKIYNQLTRACATIARQKNLDSNDVFTQIMDEAVKRGPKRPIPGQHY